MLSVSLEEARRAERLLPGHRPLRSAGGVVAPWLRTNGVHTNGAAAEVIDVDGLGKKVRPGTFGYIKVG